MTAITGRLLPPRMCSTCRRSRFERPAPAATGRSNRACTALRRRSRRGPCLGGSGPWAQQPAQNSAGSAWHDRCRPTTSRARRRRGGGPHAGRHRGLRRRRENLGAWIRSPTWRALPASVASGFMSMEAALRVRLPMAPDRMLALWQARTATDFDGPAEDANPNASPDAICKER